MNSAQVDHRSTNLLLFTLIISVAFFGLIILFSTSSFFASLNYSDPYYFLKKQSIALFLGIIILIIISQIPYRIWFNIAWPLYIFSLLLLSMVFIDGIGKQAGGAYRWIQIAGVSFQPSDIARFTTILLLSRLYSKKFVKDESQLAITDKLKIILSLVTIAIPIVLISMEPDFGTAFHLIVVSVLFLLLIDFPLTVLTIPVLVAMSAIYYSLIQIPWRLKRILAFLDPWQYRYEEGYQLVGAFRSFYEGGLWGKGLGEGIIRHKLQARHTDFIFAVIAEELGFIGLCSFLLCSLLIIVYGFIRIKKLTDHSAKLLGTGILLLYAFQLILHISVNMGLLPTTGINLPLVSYGGTSLVTYLLMFGILLNILKGEKYMHRPIVS